jgi:hypothetical protein
MEEWKWVAGYEGFYEISNQGRLRSYQASRKSPHVPHFMHLKFHRKGYLMVMLRKGGKYKAKKIHRLVAEAFVPTSDLTLSVNHIDGNKTNNGTANLEWISVAQNWRLAHEMGLLEKPQVYKDRRRGLSDAVLSQMRILFGKGFTRKAIAVEYGIPIRTVQHALRGHRAVVG